MFNEYMIQILSAKYEDRLMVFDYQGIEKRYNYGKLLTTLDFKVVRYEDAIQFRFAYENEIKTSKNKFAVLVDSEQYIPYDILQSFYCVKIGWENLFPRLNSEALVKHKTLELALLYNAYIELYEELTDYEKTNVYIREIVYGKANVEKYLSELKEKLVAFLKDEKLNHKDWCYIASQKGIAEYLAAKSGVFIDFSFVEERFKHFIQERYCTLSSLIQKDSPVMISRVMDYILKTKDKVALIVLDGMAVFDFKVLSENFENIDYQEGYIYAMIPTTTAISRQSLLAGKFPVELERPFDLSREEKEFVKKAQEAGYSEKQILYSRGYSLDISPNTKCMSIIVNDIDDLVHGQIQARNGMYNDVNLLAKSGKIQRLINELYNSGFRVYLTSDHGNTLCTGIGSIKGAGVEVETRSRRMLILKDFAEGKPLMAKYNLIEYLGYYLDKQYKYYICNNGTSFDTKGSIVMTHGGISIDEVIVPFIEIKAVQNG